MNICDREDLKRQAQQRLDTAVYPPKKLTLIHGAVTVGLSLVLSLLTVFLSYGIENTGGLSGMGLRNVLETVQTLLSYAYTLLLPFWQIGIVFVFLCIVRRQYAAPVSLLEGFRRFGPVLRLKLLELGLYFALSMICAYASSFLAMAFSGKLYALMEPVVMAMTEDPNADVAALIQQIPPEEMLEAMLPILLVFAVLYLTAVVLVGYRLRFSQYLVMDEPQAGAFAAMRMSLQMTKGHCMELFRLDLSFWQYYLLVMIAGVIGYGDLIFKALGVQLPVSGEWSAILCYCIYGALALAIDYCLRPGLEATYALAYDSLKNPLPVVSEEHL